MPYRSNRDAIATRLRRANDAGLVAAVRVPVNKTKRRLRGGYTTGHFVTGTVRASVTASAPYDVPGGRGIRWGTNQIYALFWELGHLNTFIDGPIETRTGVRTGPIRRKPVFVPAFQDTQAQAVATYARAFRRSWGGGAGLGGVDVSIGGEAGD